MKEYKVRPLKDDKNVKVAVPGSKSITNRALLLAAMSNKRCELTGVLFSADSRAFLDCLKKLGFELAVSEEERKVIICGTNGIIPKNEATINVGSAGTAARFLTVFLAFAGGKYTLEASEQMCKRPMEPLISTLRDSGVKIDCLKEDGHFPFILESSGIDVASMHSNTDVSSQFASAMLMAAPLLSNGLEVILEGSRTNGAYINITLNMMKQFGIEFTRTLNTISVSGGTGFGLESYEIEPDVSAAGYFYAMSPICNKTVCVKNVHLSSMQGDIKLLSVLEKLGCSISDTSQGIIVNPPANGSYSGIDINMNDFSDQTMTVAVIAAFAQSETKIHGINHIRFQESDRMQAIVNELNRLNCSCEMIEDCDGLRIVPDITSYHGTNIETYEDHRIAMAFALTGLRINDVTILNPMCCSKTFENYFDILDLLCE